MKSRWLCGAITVLMSVGSLRLPVFAQEAGQDNQTKTAQCDQVIAIANEAVKDAKLATNNGRSSDPEMLLRAAQYMDSHASKFEGISLSDPKLQAYQSRFIVIYQQTSIATRDFVTAFKAKNLSGAELALQALTTTTRQEKQLVDEINNYCQEEQKPTQSLTSSTRLKGTLSIVY
jgi:hypothetical protein